MKKISKKQLPANLKTSKQNINEVGRTSQGATQKPLNAREKKFLKDAKTRQSKKKSYSLKEAMMRMRNK